MRAGRSLVLTLVVLLALSAFPATWEGTAVVGISSDFPDNGLTAACNSFPKDSTIELRNLENGKLVRVVISRGLDNPGVFIVLSPKAASELGMKPGVSSRIRATVVPASSLPSPDSATASRSQDPDFNPALLAGPDTGAQPTPSAEAPASGAEAAALSPETTPAPEAAASQGHLAEAQQPTLPAGENAAVMGGDQPVPAAPETPAPAPALAAASEPPLPPSEAGTVIGGDQPTAPAVASPELGLADATASPAPAPELAASPAAGSSEGSAAPAPSPVASEATPSTEPTSTAVPAPPAGGEQVLSLEPAAARPPPSSAASTSAAPPSTAVAPAEVATAPVSTPAQEQAASPAGMAVRQPSQIDTLEKGAYYVQIGVFARYQGLVDAASDLDLAWPLAAEKVAGPKGDQYRLMVGPVARDESGLYVLRLRSLGYRDAFVRRGQ